MTNATWNLILAAGAGRRLATVTGRVPKQFWRASGAPSLLDDTIARVLPLAGPAQTVVVVDRTHRSHVIAAGLNRSVGEVIYQPQDRGTAAGVLFGIAHIATQAPDAIVAMTPSDHGVRSAAAFRDGLRSAIRHVASGRASVVLVGARADRPATDYGWILPSTTPLDGELANVHRFVEKPEPAMAEALLQSGAVWNTMVLVARVSALIDLHRRATPVLFEAFRPARDLVGRERREFFDRVYPTLPCADFSADVLTPSPSLSLVVWPGDMQWSDLGTPERLLAWRRPVERRRLATTAA
jgi:mannose-1-phosphate guanylyltransferase